MKSKYSIFGILVILVLAVGVFAKTIDITEFKYLLSAKKTYAEVADNFEDKFGDSRFSNDNGFVYAIGKTIPYSQTTKSLSLFQLDKNNLIEKKYDINISNEDIYKDINTASNTAVSASEIEIFEIELYAVTNNYIYISVYVRSANNIMYRVPIVKDEVGEVPDLASKLKIFEWNSAGVNISYNTNYRTKDGENKSVNMFYPINDSYLIYYDYNTKKLFKHFFDTGVNEELTTGFTLFSNPYTKKPYTVNGHYLCSIYDNDNGTTTINDYNSSTNSLSKIELDNKYTIDVFCEYNNGFILSATAENETIYYHYDIESKGLKEITDEILNCCKGISDKDNSSFEIISSFYAKEKIIFRVKITEETKTERKVSFRFISLNKSGNDFAFKTEDTLNSFCDKKAYLTYQAVDNPDEDKEKLLDKTNLIYVFNNIGIIAALDSSDVNRYGYIYKYDFSTDTIKKCNNLTETEQLLYQINLYSLDYDYIPAYSSMKKKDIKASYITKDKGKKYSIKGYNFYVKNGEIRALNKKSKKSYLIVKYLNTDSYNGIKTLKGYDVLCVSNGKLLIRYDTTLKSKCVLYDVKKHKSADVTASMNKFLNSNFGSGNDYDLCDTFSYGNKIYLYYLIHPSKAKTKILKNDKNKKSADVYFRLVSLDKKTMKHVNEAGITSFMKSNSIIRLNSDNTMYVDKLNLFYVDGSDLYFTEEGILPKILPEDVSNETYVFKYSIKTGKYEKIGYSKINKTLKSKFKNNYNETFEAIYRGR